MEKYNVLDAFEMFIAFMEGYNKEEKALEESAMEELGRLFGKVEPDNQEEVFLCFCEFIADMLDDDFDVTAFNF